MRKPFVALFTAAALSTLLAGSALAHHSFSAEFDATKSADLSGVVTEVRFSNPHVPIGTPSALRSTRYSPKPCFEYDSRGPVRKYRCASSIVWTPLSPMYCNQPGSLTSSITNGASSSSKRRSARRSVVSTVFKAENDLAADVRPMSVTISSAVGYRPYV